MRRRSAAGESSPDTAPSLDHVPDRVQADIDVEGGPVQLNDPVAGTAHLVGESTCQARFAEAGVAADEDWRGALGGSADGRASRPVAGA